MPSLPVCSFSLPATSRQSCSLSSVSGPAMRKSGRCRPTSKPQRRIVKLRCDGSELARAVAQRRGDVGLEQRVALARGRGELGVELHADEERVARQLHDLRQVLARRARRDLVAPGLELRDVDVVHLVAVAVALIYLFSINAESKSAF